MCNLTITLSDDLKKKVQEKAKRDGLTLSGLTVQLYKSYVAGHLDLRFTPVLIATQATGTEKPSKLTRNLLQKEVNKMTDDEKRILKALATKVKSVDDLMHETGWDMPRLSVPLVYLELKGIIEEKSDKWHLC